MESLQNTEQMNTSVFTKISENLDEELDHVVVFCHKLANGIQILQDRLGENNTDFRGIFPNGETIQKTVTYIGTSD